MSQITSTKAKKTADQTYHKVTYPRLDVPNAGLAGLHDQLSEHIKLAGLDANDVNCEEGGLQSGEKLPCKRLDQSNTVAMPGVELVRDVAPAISTDSMNLVILRLAKVIKPQALFNAVIAIGFSAIVCWLGVVIHQPMLVGMGIGYGAGVIGCTFFLAIAWQNAILVAAQTSTIAKKSDNL